MTTALIALTRWKEHVLFVMVTTLLGAQAAAPAALGRSLTALPPVIAANLLAVAFAFMWNDVEDADDDALSPSKRVRNPVAAGGLSRTAAMSASFVTAAAACGLFALVNVPVFVLGLVTLLTAYLYSWRPVRLKAIPVIDVVSHALMLAGLQFLCAYYALAPNGPAPPPEPFLFLVSFSAYGQLYNQLRDLETDRAAGLRHTAARLGPRRTRFLMIACVTAAGITAFIAISNGFVPVWVLGATAVIAAVAAIRPLRRLRPGAPLDTEPLHTPVLCAAVIALAAWMLASASNL